jgi:hypothetical protein
MINAKLIERGDPIMEWPAILQVKLYGPLADEETKILKDEDINELN